MCVCVCMPTNITCLRSFLLSTLPSRIHSTTLASPIVAFGNKRTQTHHNIAPVPGTLYLYEPPSPEKTTRASFLLQGSTVPEKGSCQCHLRLGFKDALCYLDCFLLQAYICLVCMVDIEVVGL